MLIGMVINPFRGEYVRYAASLDIPSDYARIQPGWDFLIRETKDKKGMLK
jgi:hypothetical protein